MTENVQEIQLSAAQLEELSAIADESGRLQYLSRHQLCTAFIARQLNNSARTNLRIDPHRSLAFAEAAVAIATSLGDAVVLGPSLRAKANALHVLGDNQAALNYLEEATGIFRRQGNKEEEARTLNSSIQPCILLGNYDRALHAAAQAREIFKQSGDTHRLAYVELNVGNFYHRQDRFEEALSCYERAYEMFFSFGDSEGLSVALYNMSVCLISLNDFPRALTTYQRAREMFVSQGMALLLGQADYNIAYLYYLRGEYSRAIAMLRAAREQSELNGDAHIQALCYLDLSDIYLELNLSAQASETAHQGLQRFKKLGMGYEEAKCLANEAIAWSQQGKPLHALDLFAEARSIFLREKNLAWPSLIDLYTALAFYDESRLFEAKKHCGEALKYFESSSSPGKSVLCHILLARIELQGGDFSNALKHINDGMARLKGQEIPVLEYQVHYFAGLVHSAMGNQEHAYRSYQQARESMESLKLKIRREELKIPFLKGRSAVYERLIEICLDRGGDPASLGEVFQYIELAKQRSLAEIILDEMHEVPKSIEGNSEMVRRIRDLREELNWYDRRIEIAQLRPDRDNPARTAQLETEARILEEKLVQVLHELPATAPEARLFRTAESVPVKTIQALLPPAVSLIEYFAVGEELLAAVVKGKNLEILPVTLLSSATKLVQKLRAEFSRVLLDAGQSRDGERAFQPAIHNILRSLHAELLDPLLARVSGEHIVFVPHGQLYGVPFHALYGGDRYLIDRFAVSYSHTGSACVRDRDLRGRLAESPLLTYFGGTEAQGEEIAQAIHASRVVSIGAASQESFRRYASNTRWVHVSKSIPPRNDESDSHSRLGSSHQNLADLFQLQLGNELVSLSGFSPGLSFDAAAAGEELEAVIKCVVEGGANSVISTLWNDSWQNTADYLKIFSSCYLAKQEDTSIAEIFRTSVQELRQLHPHPAHWAQYFLATSLLHK